MQNLLKESEYSTRSLIGDYRQQTQNKIAEYDIDVVLNSKYFKNYLKQRVNAQIIQCDYYKLRSIKTLLGLSTRSKASDVAIKVTDTLAEWYVQTIFALTSEKNGNNLMNELGTDSFQIPNLILDCVRMINCNYRIRRIKGTESVLRAKNLNIEAIGVDKLELDDVYINLINLVEVIRELNLDDITEINDYRELYKGNDYDLCINVKVQEDNKSIRFITGNGHCDEYTIMGLLVQTYVKNTNGFVMDTILFETTIEDGLSILKTGRPIFSSIDNIDIVEDEYVMAEVTSSINKFANREVKSTKQKPSDKETIKYKGKIKSKKEEFEKEKVNQDRSEEGKDPS